MAVPACRPASLHDDLLGRDVNGALRLQMDARLAVHDLASVERPTRVHRRREDPDAGRCDGHADQQESGTKRDGHHHTGIPHRMLLSGGDPNCRSDDRAGRLQISCRSVGPLAPVGTLGAVRIATWNVNSLKQRVPRLFPWLDERRPDVVCLQETKLADDALAEVLGDELADRGYEVAAHGEATWNGVAILSRAGLDDVVAGLDGGPGFP